MDALEMLRARLGTPAGAPSPLVPLGQQVAPGTTEDLPIDLANPIVLSRLLQLLFGNGILPRLGIGGSLHTTGSRGVVEIKGDHVLTDGIRFDDANPVPLDSWSLGIAAGTGTENAFNIVDLTTNQVLLHIRGAAGFGALIQPDNGWIYPSLGGGGRQGLVPISAGNGVPTGGSDGQFYFRGDGAAGNHIYLKITGVWTAIL